MVHALYVLIFYFFYHYFVPPVAAHLKLHIPPEVFTTVSTNVTWSRQPTDPEQWSLLVKQLSNGNTSLVIPNVLNTPANFGVLPIVFPHIGQFQLMAQNLETQQVYANSQSFAVLSSPEGNLTTNLSPSSPDASQSLGSPTVTPPAQLASQTTSSTFNSTSSSKRSTIIGCAVAAGLVTLALLVILVFIYRKRKGRSNSTFIRERMVRGPRSLGESFGTESDLERGEKVPFSPSLRSSRSSIASSLYDDTMKPQAI